MSDKHMTEKHIQRLKGFVGDSELMNESLASLERELTEWKAECARLVRRMEDDRRELTELREALREAWPLIGWRTPKERAVSQRIANLLSHHDEVREIVPSDLFFPARIQGPDDEVTG